MPNIHPSARAPRDATGSNSDKAYCQEGELDNEISVGRGEGMLFIFFLCGIDSAGRHQDGVTEK